MERRKKRGRLAGLIVTLAVLVLASGAWGEPPEGHGAHRGRGNAQARRRGNRARGPIAPIMRLIAHPKVEVDVENIDDGVAVTMTSEDEKVAEKIQDQVLDRVERFEEMRERMKDRGARRGKGRFKGKMPSLDAEAIDDGVRLAITSEDEEQVEHLQETLPEHIEAVKDRMEGLRLIRGADIDFDLEETDDGVVITITAEEEEVVEQIQEMARRRKEHWEERRERMRERRERRRNRGGKED